MSKPGRISCIVPFCRRTAPVDRYPLGQEIMCGKCWRLVTAGTRRRIKRLERFGKRLQRLAMKERNRTRYLKLRHLDRVTVFHLNKAWDRARDEATEAKVGIA